VTATSADSTNGANMSEDTDFSEPRRAALLDCVNEIFLRIEEWDEKIDLGEPSKGDE
jgi:hypothetical protein